MGREPDLPGYTCPIIDKLIEYSEKNKKIIKEVEDEIGYSFNRTMVFGDFRCLLDFVHEENKEAMENKLIEISRFLADKMEDIESNSTWTIEEIEQVRDANSSLRSYGEYWKEEYNDMESDKDDIERDLDRSKDIVRDKEYEIQSLNSKIDELEDDVSRLENKITNLEHETRTAHY